MLKRGICQTRKSLSLGDHSFSGARYAAFPGSLDIGDHVKTDVELRYNLSENTRRGIVLPGRVPPVLALNFVRKSREKIKVSGQFLSENLFRRKLGERDA